MENITAEFKKLRGDNEINGIDDCRGYSFIDTPSHGFLVVPMDDENIKVAKKICDGYGYVGKLAIYLEEDCQAPEFLKAIGKL